MNGDYEITDVSELTEQELKEHRFIEQYLNDEEIMSVALSCRNVDDIFQAQYYFALAKQNGSIDALGLLNEITRDRLKIKGVNLGVPDFEFYS